MLDIILLVIRWLHAVAAVSWVGGGLFYWVVLRPVLRKGDASSQLARSAAPEFRQVVDLAMWTLIITGVVMAADRLTAETATVTYVAVLAAKIGIALWMFGVVWTRRRGTPAQSQPAGGRIRTAAAALTSVNTTVVLGLVVFFLSDLLTFIVERELRG